MTRNVKKHILSYIAIALVFTMLGAGGAMIATHNGAATANAEAENLSTKLPGVVTSPFTEAVKAVRSSVVGVSIYGTRTYSDFYGFGFNIPSGRGDERSEEEVELGSGSGVVISDQGHVLTNYHVVEGATRLVVTTPDKDYDAQLVDYDIDLDIAILKVEGLNLNPVSLGDSDTLQVGEWAICIGNPLGRQFAETTTVGVISGLNREVTTTTTDEYNLRKKNVKDTMIQVDAAINSGNSGGGMFNVLGELMGIPTLKYTGSIYSTATVEGIGMCIPINDAKPLIEKVLSGGSRASESPDNKTPVTDPAAPVTPRMGIGVNNLLETSYAVSSGIIPTGIIIKTVEEKSPAKEAGLLVDDIIVEVDGVRITQTSQMSEILKERTVEDTLSVKVYRVPGGLTDVDMYNLPDGEYLTIDVGLAMLDTQKQ